MRAASFVEPARPDNDSDALIVLTARHSAVACVCAETKSGNGVPAPEGSVTRGDAHDAAKISRLKTVMRAFTHDRTS